MKYLAVDTSGEQLIVVARNNQKTAHIISEEKRNTSAILMSEIDRVLGEVELEVGELEFLACVVGPGSFTGIRIGVVAVKTIASLLRKPVVAVTSLKKCAYNDIGDAESVVCVVHAYADNCFIAAYNRDKQQLLEPKSATYEQVESLMQLVDEPSVLIAGYPAAERLSATADESVSSLIAIVEDEYAMGNAVDAKLVEPLYLMKSQAERELEEKERKNGN